MKRSFWLVIKEFLSRKSKKPWAAFETLGIDADERLPFAVYFNNAFVANIRAAGVPGITDEEAVQNFFLQLRVAPESFYEDEQPVSSTAHPDLSSEANQFVS